MQFCIQNLSPHTALPAFAETIEKKQTVSALIDKVTHIKGKRMVNENRVL